MGEIIKVDSSTWRKQEDASAKSINITAKGRGNKDDEAELYQHPGILSRPDGGEICAVIEVGEQKLIIATQNYDLGKEIDKGELFLYSVVGGVIKSSLLLNKNSEFIFNDGTDFAVKFNELKTGFDQLKADFNAHVATYNVHKHTGVSTGLLTSGTTDTPGASSAASIDTSKVDKIKL